MYKKLIQKLGFSPKENTSGIYQKKYTDCEDYSIEIDFEKEKINFGNKIKAESKTTQNFSQAENWVVLECVNRLLEKGYKPEDITLEKTFPSGHGHSGRLDIFIKKQGRAFLMIECKTLGKEFDKELKNINKNGGQLFTYFKNDTNTQYLMLYASQLFNDKFDYKCEIIKVEEHYRSAGNVEDIFDRWNKVTNQNGIFEDWVSAYNFENKLLIKRKLKSLKETDSSFIFHEFLSILRKHSVSDKPNAFNKIFNLFLAKIYDEKKRDNDELEFQWKEKSDDDVSFQIRLINLYQKGMLEFLRKEVEGIHDDDFNYKNDEELRKKKKKWLKFNNVFAIKEVIDDESFDDNARVLKEVVELLYKYKIRYPRKQQHLSDFFERLLTTGLKQEAGQYFSPPPITRFIVKSIPVKEAIIKELNTPTPKLPAVIDYAVGSGHFITEMMEEYQNIIDDIEISNFYDDAIKKVNSWRIDQYSWASKYIYGIEKDYRLVKVAKVGCYFYGDGLAQIIHGDGLDSFKNSNSYIGLLKQKTEETDNTKFSFVVSNPPYSISTFKGDLKNKNADKDFELYKYLTDRSSEIECLFIERTKQLLKTDGLAGIILPSSILSNIGIYTKAREIILQYFEIIAITQLGSNTFMATGTNTVILFLRRRNNADAINIKTAVDKFFVTLQDATVNSIEKPVRKYITHVWEGIAFDDYATLLKKQPNEAIQQHEIYKEYQKKIKAKNEKEKWNAIIELEQEKLFYFILAYPQKLVLVKTGEKKAEKQFLGYEFSNRRGSEGIHPIQRGKSIDDCTQLFDATVFDNPQKASTYIYKAFKGDFNFPIDESLQKNITRVNLVDMLTFNRIDFEKNISTSVRKKMEIESKWEEQKLSELLFDLESGKRPKGGVGEYQDGIPSLGGEHIDLNGKIKVTKDNLKFVPTEFYKKSKQGKLKDLDVLICKDGALTGKIALFRKNEIDYEKSMINEHIFLLRANELSLQQYLFNILYSDKGQEILKSNIAGQAQGGLNRTNLLDIKIPLPPIKIQEKIVAEIEVLEQIEKTTVNEVDGLKNSISDLMKNISKPNETKLENIALLLKRGKSAKYGNSKIQIIKSGQARGFKEFDFTQKHYVDENFVLDERKLEKGDILINSSGVGTAGRVTLFNLEGTFVVDSHVTILRPNQEKIFPDFVLQSLAKIGFRNIEAMAMGQSGQIELTIKTIQNIKIPFPPLSEQQKIVLEIEKIENQIMELRKEINTIPEQKEKVLEKYLE